VSAEEFSSITPKPKNTGAPSWKKFKRAMKRLLIPIVLAIFFILGANFWWSQNIKPVSNDISVVRFVIPKGYSASQIGNKLASQELIKSSLAFRFYVQVTGKAKKIQAGEYRLSSSFSLLKISEQFLKGPVELWVTIPEGLRREEIAERFIKGLEKEGSEAIDFRQEFLTESVGKEGFLFPDTYLFPKTASASAVVNKLFITFDQKIDDQMQKDINKSSYTLSQIMTLASIIERETKTTEERPIVSGLFYKRLEVGWPLQADATLQYAIANENCNLKIENCSWWMQLTKEDLEINSRYNTYKFAGLPPGPIANPGLSSIKAAIYPQESSYWFYLHDPQGKIHYARTIEEHNENIRKYLGK
jgi:UPF0755 protein